MAGHAASSPTSADRGSSVDEALSVRPLGDVKQAVILAAGRGSRLSGAANGRPKCLVQVGGSSLLERQLSTLAAAGITEVCVVTGYQARRVQQALRGRAHVVENRDFAETNSLYSFSLCRDWVDSACVVLNCDLLVDAELLARLIACPTSAFLYDSSSGQDEEHMKVQLSTSRGGYLTRMCKELPLTVVEGENVGMLLFDRAALPVLFEEAEQVLADGGERKWLAAAVQRAANRVPLAGIDVAGLPWTEIDYPEDLEFARAEVLPRIEAPGQAGVDHFAPEVGIAC